MEWVDEAFVLSTRQHGDTSLIVHLLTRSHGVHAGLVRGGTGRKNRGTYQPGSKVQARWRGRLTEHLGSYTCELVQSHAASVMEDRLRLSALSAACAITRVVLPEREQHEPVFDGLEVLLQSLEGEAWPTVYVKWELGLLNELGFGLDLSQCAATGATDNLIYVSPKSGKAVSSSAGAPYKDRLLVLPGFLVATGETGTLPEVLNGLRLTGYFFERHVFAPHNRHFPPARQRLVSQLSEAYNQDN